MALRRKRFPVRWARSRRVWVAGAVTVLTLLVAGVAVLSWPTDLGYSESRSAVPSAGDDATARTRAGAGGSGAAAPGVGAPGAGAPESDSVAQLPYPQPVPGVPPGATGRALVRTAQLTVSVDDAAPATRQVRTTAAAVGGVIVQEQTTGRGSWLVLRVPAESLDRVIDDIAAIGRVTDREGQVVDSTGEVVDLNARVASQQASVARVRTLLAQATSIGDIVAIESELARREADLDSLTGRLAVLRDQVALSTLTVDLRTPSTPLVDDDDDRAAGFLDGLETGWRGLLALGTATAAVLGFVLPFLPVLAVVIGLAVVTRRLLRSRRVVAPSAPGAGGPAES